MTGQLGVKDFWVFPFQHIVVIERHGSPLHGDFVIRIGCRKNRILRRLLHIHQSNVFSLVLIKRPSTVELRSIFCSNHTMIWARQLPFHHWNKE